MVAFYKIKTALSVLSLFAPDFNILALPGPKPQPQAATNVTSASLGALNSAAGAMSGTGAAGPAQDDSWKTLTCTDPAVTNATIDPTDRWNRLGCQPAWLAAVQSASTATNVAQVSWAELIPNFFHGPDKMACADLSARDGCNTNIECQDQSKGSYVPAFEILNSLVSVSSVSNSTLYSQDYGDGRCCERLIGGPRSTKLDPGAKMEAKHETNHS